MKAKILIRKGPGSGEEILLEKDLLVFGRGDDADIVLADRSASRRHCLISRDGDGWSVKDLASKNSTSVNGVPVESAELRFGDLIQLGLTTLQLLPDDRFSADQTGLFREDLTEHPETLSLAPDFLKDVEASKRTGAFRRTLDMLVRMAGLIKTQEGLAPFLEEALTLLMDTVRAGRGVAVLLDDAHVPTLRVSRSSAGEDGAVTLDRSAVERVQQTGRGLLFQNQALDPGSPEAETALDLFYSALYAPISQGPAVRGVLYLDTLGSNGELDRHSLEAAVVAGRLAGMTLGGETQPEAAARQPLPLSEQRFGMIGNAPVMRNLFSLIRKAAPTLSTVLIRGPSGSGKELVARALHRLSQRREGPFVAVNCAAIPESLLESELFGHEKGAFTGAVGRRPGRFEMASGGVLFLDEIGELPPESQVKLLRAVEEKQIQRLGSSKVIDVDVRLIAATNRDLETAMQQRTFREDLYFRLTVLTIDVPPLSDRRDDIPLLANFFLETFREELGHKICGISPPALSLLEDYRWPGNVRELKNVIERALVLASGEEIVPADLSFLPRTAMEEKEEDPLKTLKEIEEKHIARVLDKVRWNKSKAARILGIERSTLYEKLKIYHISPPRGQPRG